MCGKVKTMGPLLRVRVWGSLTMGPKQLPLQKVPDYLAIPALLQLADTGLDLTFALHTLLLRDVEKWIRDGRDKLVEAVKLRGQEDTWKILKYENKEQLNKFIEDMNDIGIASVEKYVMGECGCVGGVGGINCSRYM